MIIASVVTVSVVGSSKLQGVEHNSRGVPLFKASDVSGAPAANEAQGPPLDGCSSVLRLALRHLSIEVILMPLSSSPSMLNFLLTSAAVIQSLASAWLVFFFF